MMEPIENGPSRAQDDLYSVSERRWLEDTVLIMQRARTALTTFSARYGRMSKEAKLIIEAIDDWMLKL